jgi:hypothetical protein
MFWTCELVCASLSDCDVPIHVFMKNLLNYILIRDNNQNHRTRHLVGHTRFSPIRLSTQGMTTFKDILDEALGKSLFRRVGCFLPFFLSVHTTVNREVWWDGNAQHLYPVATRFELTSGYWLPWYILGFPCPFRHLLKHLSFLIHHCFNLFVVVTASFRNLKSN